MEDGRWSLLRGWVISGYREGGGLVEVVGGGGERLRYGVVSWKSRSRGDMSFG